MKRSIDLLRSGRIRPLLISYRFILNKSNKNYEGLRERFNENEARLYFDQWLKSLWFAPGGWTQSTKDKAITITRRYVPFWNFSLYGSLNASLQLADITTTRQGKAFVPSQRWHSAPIQMNNISLFQIGWDLNIVPQIK